MFLLDHSKEIASLLAPVLTATFGWLSKGRARLLCAQRHGFTFYIPPEADSSGQQRDAITVHTISYFIRNDGKIPLNGVEVVWQWKPDGMHLWPPRPFSQEQTHDGRHVVGIKSLAPGEDFLVEVIGFGSALPQMQSCRSEQAVAVRQCVSYRTAGSRFCLPEAAGFAAGSVDFKGRARSPCKPASLQPM